MKEQRQHKVSVDHGKTKSETWRRRRGRAFATQAELSLSFSSGEQPLHKLLRLFVLSKTFALDSSTIFYKCNFFFTYFSLQVFVFYICYHKKHDMFNKCLFLKKKKQLHNECSWCLTRTVTMDLLLCTLSNVWCHLHTEGPICWNLTADGLYYLKNVWLPAKTQLSFSPLVNCAKKLKQQ